MTVPYIRTTFRFEEENVVSDTSNVPNVCGITLPILCAVLWDFEAGWCSKKWRRTTMCPLSSDRQHLSCDVCLGGKRGDYQNCSVLYYVLKLCTVISTLRWAVLTVLWIGFCHTGPMSLCIDLFVFICVYFVCFCFLLHICCIIVSTVGWTWRDWSLILRTYLSSVLWHCLLGHLTHKNPSPIDL